MKNAGIAIVVVLTLIGLAEPLAQASESSMKSAHCGDHWLSVDIQLKDDSNEAVVEFSGDSNPDPAQIVGTYQLSAGYDLVVNFNLGNGSRIEIDGHDAYHNIYWGTYFAGGTESSLGLCSVSF